MQNMCYSYLDQDPLKHKLFIYFKERNTSLIGLPLSLITEINYINS
jgi:hypothetical protein